MMWAPERVTKVTVELRELVESGVNIWDFDYPSYYKGEAKQAFEQKVLNHFWLRQIGAETPGRFLHYFRNTMREIMPLYIQRYESVDLMKDPEIRPLDNYNMIEEYEQENGSETSSESSANRSSSSNASGTSESTTSSTSSDKLVENNTGSNASTGKETEVHSDTPQGTLNISIPAYPADQTKAETIDHASDVTQRFTGSNAIESRDTTRDGTSNANASITGKSTDLVSDQEETAGTNKETQSGNQKHKLTRRGNIGVTTYAQLLEGYRETFLNIDMEIINELESCFLGVF